ncbi:MAG: tetratricopeptide repeat protein [Luteolibacter sp.]
MKTLRHPAVTIAGAALWLLPLSLHAQEPATPPAQFDPSDVYFQGYLAARAAEQLERDGDYIGAWQKLDQANKLFQSVLQYYPGWKPEMVRGRAEKTHESLSAVRPKAEEQQKKQSGAIAELEGGTRSKGHDIDPRQGVQPLTPGILEVDPLASRRLSEAEAEVKRLRQSIADARTSSTEASRNASRLRDVERQRDLAEAQLKAAEASVRQLRSQLAGSPVESEMKALNGRIEKLEQEKAAMGMALSQSRNEKLDAEAKIALLETDLKLMKERATELRQQNANQQRDLKTQQDVANKVVAGQRRQIEQLEKQLEQKNTELANAHQQITGLRRQLDESQESFSQLLAERDALVQERDQMSALLKLNEGGRIQQLVEQNMALAKNLREANEKVERLNLDNNATKDEMTDALRDLAMAKSQINRLHQEKRDQDKRLAELENRLKGEEAALAAGSASADPAEVETLRDIIRRQLLAQERRKQARDLLVEAAKQMGSKDERIAQAVELFDAEEIQLSPEEQRLIASQQVNGEFVSPFVRDRSFVNRATTSLNIELEGYDRAAEKAFLSGRLLPTRELYQMILDANPGNTSALCKLGVVNLRLNDTQAAIDTFRRAVEMDEKNAYAHRMLGYAFMTSGDLRSAEEHTRRSVELAPEDAKSQMLMGSLCYRNGRVKEAESHYKAAITADPVLSEPYFNLAWIYARNNRAEDTRSYYQQALERGAVPDPALEQWLDSTP